MTLRPTLSQIIKTDFIALVAAITSPVCLVMAGLAAAGWLPALRGTLGGADAFIPPECRRAA